MKIPSALLNKALWQMFVAYGMGILCLYACHDMTSEKTHYPVENKNFGNPDVPDGVDGDAQTSVVGDPSASKEVDVKGEGNKQVIVDAGSEAAEQVIPADRIIFRSSFRGKIIRSRLFFIYVDPLTEDVSMIPPEDASFYHDMPTSNYAIRRGNGPEIERFAQQPINLIAEQTYGNEGQSLFRQVIESPTDTENGGGLEYFKGDSASGEHLYDRVSGPDSGCHPAFVCVKRSVTRPRLGRPKTFCYKDIKTGKSAVIPVGASPGGIRSDYEQAPENLGPFEVRRFDGEFVDCDSKVLHPDAKSVVQITTGIEDRSDVLYMVNSNVPEKLGVDFGVRFIVERLEDGRVVSNELPPYLDIEAGLQARTTYFFNEKERTLVSILKNIRRPISIPGTASLIYSGFKGVVADVVFTLCQDLLVPHSKPMCE